MTHRSDMIQACDVSNVGEVYPGAVEITDLKGELGTKGHVLVVRGDKAYTDILGDNAHLANPKFWLYDALINSQRIQEQLKRHPGHKLFDGVSHSGLEALGFHANNLGRKAVVVMAHEHVPDPTVFDRYNIEVIHATGPAEVGYVNKQREVLSQRDDLIPMHQALYGAQGLAPVGNAVVSRLEELCINPDETYWCIASGSNLYGIGTKIKAKFGSQIIVVEPKIERTIDSSLDLSDPEAVKSFASTKLRDYSLSNWNRINSGIYPLHVKYPNKYLLVNWLRTGKTDIDSSIGVDSNQVHRIQRKLRQLSLEYDWSKTTALTMVPAIKAAKKGRNVLVMSYGKDRENKSRDCTLLDSIPRILRNETPLQKVAAAVVLAGWVTVGSYVTFTDTPVFNGFAVVDNVGETWVSDMVERQRILSNNKAN